MRRETDVDKHSGIRKPFKRELVLGRRILLVQVRTGGMDRGRVVTVFERCDKAERVAANIMWFYDHLCMQDGWGTCRR